MLRLTILASFIWFDQLANEVDHGLPVDNGKGDELKSVDAKPDNANPDNTKSDEPKQDDTKPQEPAIDLSKTQQQYPRYLKRFLLYDPKVWEYRPYDPSSRVAQTVEVDHNNYFYVDVRYENKYSTSFYSTHNP
jgi:hypothetical protein